MTEQAPHVLVADDDAALAELVAEGLLARGFHPEVFTNAERAAKRIDEGAFAALVTDLRMPGHDGLALLERARTAAPDAPVIVMTAFSGVESAVECIRRGAYHYLTKPFKMDELGLFLERGLRDVALRQERRTLKRELRESLSGIVGRTAALRAVNDVILRVADADVPLLVLGETGTGKGLVARALHAASRREGGPFVSINCAALPDNLLESELFGHAKGAFTGATTARDGLFRAAHGGTLLLDEIGELAPGLQAKLLHTLETGTIRPLGETRERQVDVRVVAATHRNLRAAVEAGSFREDLLYRLDVVSVEIPALRHRRDDIPLLLEHFFTVHRRKHQQAIAEGFSRTALDKLMTYEWPGNVRELSHVVERVVLLARTREAAVEDLPTPIRESAAHGPLQFGPGPVRPLREVQRAYASWAFERCGGEKRATCEALGIDYKTLTKYLGS